MTAAVPFALGRSSVMLSRVVSGVVLCMIWGQSLAQDTQSPVTSQSVPTQDQSFVDPTVSFEGTVTDQGGSGLLRTDLLFYAYAEERWFDPIDGSYQSRSGPAKVAASLSGDSSSARWSAQLSFPAGSYRSYVRGVDRMGNREPWVERDFSVMDANQDTQSPVTSQSVPTQGQSFVGPTVSFEGTVTDQGGSGLLRTDLLLYAYAQERWFDPIDGSYQSRSGPAKVAASLSGDSSSARWSAQLSFPAGSYRSYVRGVDRMGNREPWVERDFSVMDANQDTQSPVTSQSVPTQGQSFVGPTVSFEGTVTDQGGSGLLRTDLLFYSYAERRWFDPTDGSYRSRSGPAKITATLSGNRSDAQWSARLSFPVGRYRSYVRGVDRSGNREAWVERDFSVAGVGAPPPPPPNPFR